MSKCPYCGDTRLSFNPRSTRQFDEGDLFHCNGCGGEGESVNLIEEVPVPQCNQCDKPATVQDTEYDEFYCNDHARQ